jgi:phage virion morphogenesis protein
MNLEDGNKIFQERMQKLQDFVESDDIKDIMGVEAQTHYQMSFVREGFTDESLDPWQDVKRRDDKSEWYGHSGQTGKFSQARTAAKILTGETSELRDSIYYEYTDNGVRITSPTPYGRVHQFGLQAKIYGKKAFTMIARPFMGYSKVMVGNIKDKIRREFVKILKG